MPACSFNVDWARCWLFASTFEELQVLGSTCSHPPGSRQPIAGAVDDKGLFLSRTTATCSPDLCDALAARISPLLSHGNTVYSLESMEIFLPSKGRNDLPNARNDGGGLTSHADWSQSNSAQDPNERNFWIFATNCDILTSVVFAQNLGTICGIGHVGDAAFSIYEDRFTCYLEGFIYVTCFPL